MDEQRKRSFCNENNSPPHSITVDTIGSVEYLFFWQEYEDNGFLSQWYPSPFTVEGLTYHTCEQYVMAKKALALRDFEHYILIMNEPDPKRVTELGEAVHNYNGTNWNEYIEEIVYNANYARFSQNSDLKYALLSTGSKMLVEASPNDRVFGIGLAASDPNAKIPSKWNGKNILGSVLGRVRDAIKLS